ncbi:hypothetical protein EsH8_IX_000813 [Colletotrichum jinshuiense]
MSSLPPDPYKILGVSKDAQLPEIRSAHRKLVLKCHPDKVQDPTLKAVKQDEFQKVQQAYELLSNDNDRAKYDDNVKLAELRKEMAKGMSANTSAPRAPSARAYEVRTAEPRSDTFKTTYRPSPGTKMYSQYPSRSWDEEIHRSSPIFEEPRARRAASYEKPSRQEDDRDRERERERDRRRRKEDEEAAMRAAERRALDRERERLAEKRAQEKAAEKAAKRAQEKAQEEKEFRRAERKRLEKVEKEREKMRKREAEEKLSRHKVAHIEPFDDEVTYVAKSEKKKSSSTKEKEKDKDRRARSIPRDSVPREEPPAMPLPLADPKAKMTESMMYAATYMDQSRKAVHPGLGRSQTFHEVRYQPPIAAPTPPAAAPFPPPPPPIPTSEEDVGRRSKSRRSSETKTRDKSSHKKSSPTKEAPSVPPSPIVLDASPSSRHMPQFASMQSSPSTSPPKHLGRSATFNDGYNRPPPGPVRAQTFHHVPADADLRGRHRSRLDPQVYNEESESEDDRRYRRSQRQKTHSPEPMAPGYGRRTQYTVNSGRAVPVEASYPSMYRDESPPPRKHSKATYYDVRPPGPSRETSYTSTSGNPYFSKVKTARYDDVQYSNVPRYPRDEYASAYA